MEYVLWSVLIMVVLKPRICLKVRIYNITDSPIPPCSNRFLIDFQMLVLNIRLIFGLRFSCLKHDFAVIKKYIDHVQRKRRP